jgi:hypothetical protein
MIADAPATVNPNGVVGEGPRMPKRTAWVDLPDEYGAAGMRMRVVTNYTYGTWKALQGLAEAGGLDAALTATVLEHNGWCSEDGTPLPPCDTAGFWWLDAVSPELVGVVIATLLDVPRQYPKGLRQSGER